MKKLIGLCLLLSVTKLICMELQPNPILQNLNNRTLKTYQSENNVTLNGNQVIGGDKVFENDVTFNGNNAHSGTETFTSAVIISSVSRFSDGSEQTTAYQVLDSSRIVVGNGTTVSAITNTSFSNLAGFTIGLTVHNNSRIMCGIIGQGAHNSTEELAVGMSFDGASPTAWTGTGQVIDKANISFTDISGKLTAGYHYVFLQVKVSAGTGYIWQSAARPLTIWAQEIR